MVVDSGPLPKGKDNFKEIGRTIAITSWPGSS